MALLEIPPRSLSCFTNEQFETYGLDQSFKFLLSVYYVPGTLLGSGNAARAKEMRVHDPKKLPFSLEQTVVK